MNPIFISAYAVNYEDYARLEQWVRNAPVPGVGVELGTSWKTPDFWETQETNLPRFADIPITLHAPFTEICTAPGSEQERKMEALFERACDLYHRVGALSMVMHTHQGHFADDMWARSRVRQVLNHWIPCMSAQGLSITVENVGYPGKNNRLFDQRQYVELFDDLPEETGSLIDLGHALLNGWDVPRLIQTLGTTIKGYHLNNNDGIHDSHLPLYAPDGVYSSAQVDELIGLIQEVTPEAHLILEYSPKSGVTEKGIHGDLRRIAKDKS